MRFTTNDSSRINDPKHNQLLDIIIESPLIIIIHELMLIMNLKDGGKYIALESAFSLQKLALIFMLITAIWSSIVLSEATFLWHLSLSSCLFRVFDNSVFFKEKNDSLELFQSLNEDFS
jgi:hypothetical protein